MTDVTEVQEVVWDGVARGYIPPPELRMHESVKLSSDAVDDIDPITFEVIRHSLLNANFEHGFVLQKLCVSPVTVLAKDFQASILTESGDLVYLGPNLQYFSNSQSLVVKWILENRGGAPGIRPGDMFLSNDPYIGSPHQSDVSLVTPVFVGDEIFAWVCNTMHVTDIGGSMPGSFCIDARDMFDDPIAFPPVKLVEGGEVRPDIEETFIRQSRVPVAVRMDLRAGISGNESTREALDGLIERYGALVVKGVMRRILDASEETFLSRLRQIPDGEWSARLYTEAARTLDRGIYRYQLNLRKEGDTLTFDNEGTDPQVGAINATYAGLTGGSLAALTAIMASDVTGAYGGVYRRVNFEPVPGTMSCADYPAAVSPAGSVTMQVILALAATAVGKMVACGTEEVKRLLLGPSIPQFSVAIWAGTNLDDSYYVGINADGMIGSISAMSWRDGMDCGGHYWIPGGTAANVEQYERQYPVLYLYRRMLSCSVEGAGRYRGGLGFSDGWLPWKGGAQEVGLYLNESFPKQQGHFGANPMGKGSFRWRRNVGLDDAFAQGRVPQSLDEMGGEEQFVVFKGEGLTVAETDAVEMVSCTTAGYGDQLLRDLDRVQRDVDAQRLTAEVAEAVYGAVIADGVVDEQASQARRGEMFAARLAAASDPRAIAEAQPVAGPGDVSVGDTLALRGGGSAGTYCCTRCDRALVDAGANYKDGCLLIEQPMTDVAPEFRSADLDMAQEIVFREFLCPGCGVRFDTEIARRGDDWLWDVRLG